MMIAAFLAGAAGNTSTLIGFSFAAQYKEVFVSALSAGFGLSGLVPSILNWIQNTGANYVRVLLWSILHSPQNTLHFSFFFFNTDMSSIE
jgi:uncharacterized membrane protein